MEIQLTAKQIKVTPAIRNYVQEKVERTQKHFENIVRAQVFLYIEKRAHNAEIVVQAPGQTFRALATAADLYSAVDLAAAKIDNQLKKYKDRIKSKHKGGWDETQAAVEAPPEAIKFSVVKQPLSPMTPAQAAEEMDLLGHNFRLFQDRDSRQIHVIYRRSDESLGILQPVRKGGG